MCDMTPSYVRRNSFICVTWLIHMCDVTAWHVFHGRRLLSTPLNTSTIWKFEKHRYKFKSSQIFSLNLYHEILSKFSDLLHIRGAACSEISGVQHVQRYTLYRAAKTHKQLNFRKRATNYRALLRKIAYNDKATYESSPPCTGVTSLISHVCYGVATISRINKIIGLFCRIASLLWGSFAKETYTFIDATNISQIIWLMHVCAMTSS